MPPPEPERDPTPHPAAHRARDHRRGSEVLARPSPDATALPSPALRAAAALSFLPALPLCVAHGALSREIVPALGLVPLSCSAAASLFLVLRARRAGEGPGGGHVGDVEDVEEGGGGGDGGAEGSVWTHRIVVFVVDVVLAAGLMVVLVFTWIATGKSERAQRADLAMLAAYCTMPLLVNFLIHVYLALREFSAGLALPGLVEYAAWRAVPPDCPSCGNRLRPDALPPIPWYETVSRPRISLPRARSAPRAPRPATRVPGFSGLRGREWKVPNWMRGRRQEDASLFVDDEQNERDRYRDEPEEPHAAPSSTTVVATGSAGSAPVEEVVVGKKGKKSRSSASPDLFGEEDPSWS